MFVAMTIKKIIHIRIETYELLAIRFSKPVKTFSIKRALARLRSLLRKSKEQRLPKRRRPLLKTLFNFVLSLTLVSAAQAGVQQAFVSVSGRDGAACSDTHPCRTFAAGLAAVAPGGTVIAVDSGEFGPVTITKPVTILGAPGVHTEIATTGIAASINVAASDAVVLRNLHLSGPNVPGQSVGVQVGTIGSLHVDGCEVEGFATGIQTRSGRLFVNDSLVRNCFTAVDVGLFTSTTRAYAIIQHSRIADSLTGMMLESFSDVVVRDSAIAGNGFGVYLFSNGASSTVIRGTLESCDIRNNDTGIGSNNTGLGSEIVVRVSACTITRNAAAIVPVQGTQVLSRGNNNMFDNGGFENFTGSYSAK
jgi:hypothetical protein